MSITSSPPTLHHNVTKGLSQQFILPMNKKLQSIPIGKIYIQFEETEQTSEPDMVKILELSDQGFKTTIINMQSAHSTG